MNKKPIDKTIPKFWRHKNRRLSAEPLFSLIDGLELTNTQIGEALNIHRTTINKWREKGIPIYQADKIACWIGVHPSYIWGNQWWSSTSIN